MSNDRPRRDRAARAGSTLLVLSLGLALSPGLYDGAHADSTPVPIELTSDSGGLRTVEIAVPDGLEPPFSVRGVLRVDRVVPGDVSLLVDGETISSKPVEASREVNVPVPVDAVQDDGLLELGVRYDPPADRTACATEPLGVSLGDLELLFEGAETAPTSVDDFFPVQSPRLDVLVPTGADADVLGAALSTVAALAWRYPDAQVGLRAVDDPPPAVGAGQRAVRLTPAPGALETSVETLDGVETLTLAGDPDALRDAARALAPDPPTPVGPTRSLDDLGASDVSVAVSGYGATGTTLRVPQDAFGGPARTLALHLEGTHTALPEGVTGQVEVYLDDFPVASARLGDERAFTLDATAPARALAPVNELRLQLTTLPTDGDCAAENGDPVTLTLDPAASLLTATVADAPRADLAALPAALEGRVDVALRGSPGAPLVRRARQAAPVLAALQQAAARPLEVALVRPADLVSGDASGLLVGADRRDAAALGAPIPLDDAVPAVGDQAYAAVQSVSPPERHVVLLGAWAPEQDPGGDQGALDRAAYAVAVEGWASLTGDAVVYAAGIDPVTVTAPPRPRAAPETPTRAPAAGADSPVRWSALGGAALLVLLVLVVLLVLLAARRLIRTRRGHGPRDLPGESSHAHSAEDPADAGGGRGAAPTAPQGATASQRASTGGADRRRPAGAAPTPRRRIVAGIRRDRRP